MGTNGQIAVGRQERPAINTNGSISHKCIFIQTMKIRAIKPTQTKAPEVDNFDPKNYSRVEFFCDILQLKFIQTWSSKALWHTPHRCISSSLFHILLQVHLWTNPMPSSICIDKQFNWRFPGLSVIKPEKNSTKSYKAREEQHQKVRL